MSSEIAKGAKITLTVNRENISGMSDCKVWIENGFLDELLTIRARVGAYDSDHDKSMATGRMIGNAPQIQTIPKERVGADYAELELRLMTCMFPGEDGVGADIVNDEAVLSSAMIKSDAVTQAIHRSVNANLVCPSCEVPWQEVVLFRSSVFDCPCCGAKKEDYVVP